MASVIDSVRQETIIARAAAWLRRPSGRRPGALAQGGRLLSALYFLAMALGVNALYLLRHPEQYDGIADLALVPPVEWLTREVIRPHATAFTLLLVVFEVTVALLMLGKGVAIKVGLMAAILFQFAVIAAVGVYGLVNLPVIAFQVWLLRFDYDRSLAGLMRHHVASPRRRRGASDDAR